MRFILGKMASKNDYAIIHCNRCYAAKRDYTNMPEKSEQLTFALALENIFFRFHFVFAINAKKTSQQHLPLALHSSCTTFYYLFVFFSQRPKQILHKMFIKCELMR